MGGAVTVTSGVAKGEHYTESKGADAKKGRGHLEQPLHFTEERMTTGDVRSIQRATIEPR